MVPLLHSPMLSEMTGVRHAFFTRRGGVSRGIYESLNTGLGSGDDPARVAENRRRAADVFGLEAGRLNTPYQLHSAEVRVADAAWGERRPRGDGVATRAPGLICGALAADCAPVLLADARAGVVAAVHAGWRGALDGVIEAAVAAMLDLGAKPSRLVAAVGPCIGPDSYEVGPEFLARFKAEAPGSETFFAAATAPDKRRFDLPAFVLSRLASAGVERAEWIGRDTYAEEDEFFSNRRALHRGEDGYGRLLSAVLLENR
ncbi:MAG: peptidoglycan editing factor PgeF [Caulobacteraceae bacterium]